ncbi:MAG: GntR family transcriptional regulator [Bacteroidota bacterium]
MIEKNILRVAVRDILLEYMMHNTIKPGQRISLPQLSKALGVSATPLREALTQLSETGLVTYIANRGFFVTELQEQEALEIYELIALLEAQAIRESHYTEKDLAELSLLNLQFKDAESSIDKLSLDRQFHQRLIQQYPNRYAKKIIEDIRIRVIVYELEFMTAYPVEASMQMHAEMIEALREHQPAKATQILQENWAISKNHILNNL